jgi:hypothetical protein
MSTVWNTKYGLRRVKEAAPTLAEAIFAAKGLVDDVEGQAEIAASLMGLPIEEVKAEILKAARRNVRLTEVSSFRRGAQRTVVVEHRAPRRINMQRRLGS